MTASYLDLSVSELQKRAAALGERLAPCVICPRTCGADRTAGETGCCRTAAGPVVASAFAHFGEETPVSGRYGSGTIFFSNCNLGCVFCQNWEISAGGEGETISCDELAGMMTDLQRRGCHNINFVTPTHQIYAIVKAVSIAAEQGLSVPLVYNCGGYESVETLKLLDGIVDIYMPDFKYGSNDGGMKYSGVPDYFDRACEALREMHRQTGDFTADGSGVMTRGLLVRHLVLPGRAAVSEPVLEFLAREISTGIYLNIMDQYHPCHRSSGFPELSRRVSASEHAAVVTHARELGFVHICRG